LKRAITGRTVSPSVALKILLYSYAITFKIDPFHAITTPIVFMKEMVEIHSLVKEQEGRQIEQSMKKMK
tara:strand:- start:211 stop:417 length:207 start_codon:yes stop_codon:yes gene_type:complete